MTLAAVVIVGMTYAIVRNRARGQTITAPSVAAATVAATLTRRRPTMRTMLAYLVDRRGQTVALSQDEVGRLYWQSDVPDMEKQANRFVPLNAIPESGGNQAAWAIRQLNEYIPGESAVVATAIRPIDKNYGIPPRPDLAKYGTDLWADAESPERYAASKGDGSKVKMRLFVYSTGDEETSRPLGNRDQWEAFARWAEQQGGELRRLAIAGHTDEFRTADAITALQGQLMRAQVPDEHAAVADVLRDATKEKGVEGLLVSLDV